MGNYTFGVPQDLALSIRDEMKAKTFIETGTYKAGTVRWALDHFETIHTIELNESRYNRVNHESMPTIKFHFGNSGVKLAEILEDVKEPILFWLDAHGLNNPDETTYDDTECPLLAELDIILNWQTKTKQPCAILIDDARLFLNPPPLPYTPSRWPTIVQVEQKLEGFYIGVSKDVIVAVPPKFSKLVDGWV